MDPSDTQCVSAHTQSIQLIVLQINVFKQLETVDALDACDGVEAELESARRQRRRMKKEEEKGKGKKLNSC